MDVVLQVPRHATVRGTLVDGRGVPIAGSRVSALRGRAAKSSIAAT